jgi:hypothetical protein
MPQLTLLDIVKMNGSDASVGLIDECAKAVPEVTGKTMLGTKTLVIPGVGNARTIKGIQYKTLIRTGLPPVGFRHANEGTTPTKASYENRNVECFLMNPQWQADKAVADVHEDGWQVVLALEAAAHVESAFQTLGKQFYYGAQSIGDAKGHPGLIDSIHADYTVDATGTTANTGSSVWGVKFGAQYVQWVWGNNGELIPSDVKEQRVLDAGGKPYTAYCQELMARPGLQVINYRGIGRIKNLTADSGKGLTDDLVADLLSKYPVGITPDVLFMTKRSRSQLQKSRTATNATGAPAPMPEESHGIPIAVTESILNTEAIA